MEGQVKETQIIETLKRAIDLYLVKNFDIFGYCFVEDINLSKDGKRATVLIGFNGEVNDSIDFDKSAITKSIKKSLKIRFIPKLEFVKLN